MATTTYWLNDVWFVLIAFLVAGYAVLDGFDLGVGILHLFARDEEERQIHIRSIAPVWDGNEVWLLAAGGALFAAFPVAYATLFSGFYLALMLLVLALIARAVSLEFRNAAESPVWRRAWDRAFGLGSLVAALLLGVAAGNLLRGLPVGPNGAWEGSFLGLLSPYALLVGFLVTVACTLHGALWLRLKSEGPLGERMARWAVWLWAALVVLLVAAVVATLVAVPDVPANARHRPWASVGAAALLAGLVGALLFTRKGRPGLAFLSSAAAIAGMVGFAAASLYPDLLRSTLGMSNSLSIGNAASTPRTLLTMLVIAGVGMPLVLAYTAVIYAIFRGKVSAKTAGY